MKNKYQQAFTLIEILAVLALLSVLLMLAAPSFRDFQRSSQLSSQTNTLIAALHSAKNEAIKNNNPSYLVPIDGTNWNKGWIIFVDRDFDQSYSATADLKILEGEPLPEIIELKGNNSASGGTPYISFDGSGYPRLKNSNPAALALTFKIKGLSGPEEVRNTRHIFLAITGRIRSCKPASASDTNCNATLSE